MINLLIIDDHDLFRSCLRDALSRQEGINVVAAEVYTPAIFDKLKPTRIDIILLDIFMPDLSGLELIQLFKKEYPEVKVIIVSMCIDPQVICKVVDYGVNAFVSKGDDFDSLVRAIFSVNENKIFKNKIFTDALYWNALKVYREQPDTHKVEFSEREKKMLRLLWEERSNKEIASELFLGIRSIEKMRQDMKEKVGVKTTIGLIKYALHHRIIGVDRAGQMVNFWERVKSS
jgi:DNA-binding NarL/FixJ family response regulator